RRILYSRRGPRHFPYTTLFRSRPCGDGPRRSSAGCSAARPLDTRADSGRGTSDGHAARGAEIRVLGAVLRRVTGPLLHHIGVSNAAKEIADEPIQSLAS